MPHSGHGVDGTKSMQMRSVVALPSPGWPIRKPGGDAHPLALPCLQRTTGECSPRTKRGPLCPPVALSEPRALSAPFHAEGIFPPTHPAAGFPDNSQVHKQGAMLKNSSNSLRNYMLPNRGYSTTAVRRRRRERSKRKDGSGDENARNSSEQLVAIWEL